MTKEEIIAKVKKLGYWMEGKLEKLLSIFISAGTRPADQQDMIPAMLLTGVPGAGKTFMAECFGKALSAATVFYQCNAGTGKADLIGDINVASVIRSDSTHVMTDGVLVEAVKKSVQGQSVVLILDEWDKTDPEMDGFLLDFLQSRRIRDNAGTTLTAAGQNVWVFLTSNGDRDLSDALLNRLRKVEVKKISSEQVSNLLGIKAGHPLLRLWDSIPDLSLRQVKSYINDVGGANEPLDLDVLGQYVDVSALESEDEKSTDKADETKPDGSELCTLTIEADVSNASSAERDQLIEAIFPDRIEGNDGEELTLTVKSESDWQQLSSTAVKGTWHDVRVRVSCKGWGDDARNSYCFGLPVELVERKYELIRKGEKILLRGKEPGYRPAVATQNGKVITVYFSRYDGADDFVKDLVWGPRGY